MYPLQRCNADGHHFCEEEYFQAAAEYMKTQANTQLNDFVRGEYEESGIGGLVEDRIRVFIDMGADINNIDHEDGNTPLIAAVLNDDIEIVSMLLFYKANIMTENSEGLNVFDVMNFVENETGESFSERIKELLLTNFKNTSN